jgi:hypothetical protein
MDTSVLEREDPTPRVDEQDLPVTCLYHVHITGRQIVYLPQMPAL